MKKLLYFLFGSFLFILPLVSSAEEVYFQQGKFSLMLGSGVTSLNSWYQTVLNCNWRDGGEVVYVGECAYTFDPHSSFSHLLYPIFDAWQIACNYTYRKSWKYVEKANELNFYILAKFNRFPWRHYLATSFAIGEGLSYDDFVMSTDRDNLAVPPEHYNKILNYLVIDLGFSLPKYPQLELVFRYYHRCSCFGWFPKYDRVGSTGIMGGIRWYFK